MQSPSTTSSEARAFLAAHFGYDVGDVDLVGEGWWSRCFAFHERGRDLVVRFGGHVTDFEKDRRASGFASAALPVPQVVDVGPAFDGYYAISTRAYGEPLEVSDARGWEAVLPALFAALDALQAIEPIGAGFGPWGADGNGPYRTWREFLLDVDREQHARRAPDWRQRLRDTPTGDAPFVAGMEALRTLADACPDERHVVHGDLVNRNVLVDRDRITAVLDWGCASYGDFVYDVAWLAFWEPWYPALTEIDICARARHHYASIGLDVPDFDARVRACMLHVGLDHQAWNVTTGDLETLATVVERTNTLID